MHAFDDLPFPCVPDSDEPRDTAPAPYKPLRF